MGNTKKTFYKSNLKASELYVTLRTLTNSAWSAEYGDDTGTLWCKKVYAQYEFVNGQKTNTQTGWCYQCIVKERNNATVFVKVNDLNCVVNTAELELHEIPLKFTDFRGVWWVDKDNHMQFSCKAELAEVVS